MISRGDPGEAFQEAAGPLGLERKRATAINAQGGCQRECGGQTGGGIARGPERGSVSPREILVTWRVQL